MVGKETSGGHKGYRNSKESVDCACVLSGGTSVQVLCRTQRAGRVGRLVGPIYVGPLAVYESMSWDARCGGERSGSTGLTAA